MLAYFLTELFILNLNPEYMAFFIIVKSPSASYEDIYLNLLGLLNRKANAIVSKCTLFEIDVKYTHKKCLLNS